MNLLGTVRRIWGSGEDEDEENTRDYQDAENDDFDPDYLRSGKSGNYSSYDSDPGYNSSDYSGSSMSNSSKFASSPYSSSASTRSNFSASSINPPASSAGSASAASSSAAAARLRSMNPTLRSREKNIYTIKPKRLDEATVAADCLKTGSAVIVNLEAVDRVTAVRIVDFMSGVCYGIDGAQGQNGHAMKLGEMIFLFTPAEFEISSDETDYAANHEHFFREITAAQGGHSSVAPQISVSPSVTPSAPSPTPSSPGNSSFASSYNTPDYTAERRAWER